MSKYGLQEDFKSFSPGSNTDAKLNNFSRLEPSLRLLQVPFNSNIRLRQQFPRQIQVDMEELVKMFDKKRLENLEKALNAEYVNSSYLNHVTDPLLLNNWIIRFAHVTIVWLYGYSHLGKDRFWLYGYSHLGMVKRLFIGAIL
eukprot:sb/3474078/